MERYDIIIIGGGPTGIQVGIEAQKAGLSYLILEKGSLVNSIYHFPVNMTFFSTSEKLEIGGIPFVSHNPRPTRQEALEYYRRLLTTYDLNINFYEEVMDVGKFNQDSFVLDTTSAQYHADNVVIATGFYGIPHMMNIPGESLPHVNHYYDDPHKYINQKVTIIGAANSAVDAALECWHKGADVTMLIRGSEISDRVKYWIRPNIINRIKEGSIKAEFNTKVEKITENKVFYSRNGKQYDISTDYVLALTGYQPDYDFLKKCGVEIDNNDAQTPSCLSETLESNIPNLYLAGVVNCGFVTHKLFIENTRDNGEIIVKNILEKM